MIEAKPTDFIQTEIEIAKYAKALAHPARIAILNLLKARNACICGDIVDELPLAQSTVSQHLKELKSVGLIKGDIEGTKVCYCIDDQKWEQVQALWNDFFKHFNLGKMKTDVQLKEIVKQKYSEIALQEKEVNQSSCCGAGGCSTEVYNIMTDDYTDLLGYNPDADLGLGCGLPTQYAKIQKGNTVIDLGSGAGNDCFIAREEVGESGKVIGIDFTTAMIEKARINAKKLGFTNVHFIQGDIEEMPVESNIADVVVSNCVLNLVPNKEEVIKEIYRVLKPGGHFSISDVVLIGELPENLQKDAEMYAGCVSGAIQKEEYLGFISNNGFTNVSVQKEKSIIIPDDILGKYLDNAELEAFKHGNTGIFSVTVYAEKPVIL
jgi:arsenite methyltransferase